MDRKQAPKIKDAVDFNLVLKPYEKYILKNGAEVYAVNAGAEEVIQIEWVFYAGNWFEKRNLVAASTNFLLKNGTSTKTAFQVNEHFEYYGSYLNRSCFNETAVVTLHCLSKHLEILLPVVKELLVDSIFPEEEINVYRQNMKQRLNVNLKKSDFVAGRLIDAYLFGNDHPYGKFSTFEDFDAVNREELVNFYQDYYTKGKFIVFAAGRLPSNLNALIDHHFGDIHCSKVEVFDIAPKNAEEKKYRIMNDPQGVQGAIRLGANFPNRHHPDFMKVQVLNNLFGGFFGSRLMSNIREDKGYTYGIYSYIQNHIKETAWIISTEAGRDVCEATVVEIYKEMEILRNEPVADEELLLVRNYMMGSILGDLDGPFHIINRWKNIILNGLDGDYFYNQIDAIKKVKAEEIRQLANKYLHPEQFYELVVV
jgi:predicted Zn-dependent peptidase